MSKFSTVAKGIIITMGLSGIADARHAPYHSLNDWKGLYAGIDAGVVFNNAPLKSQHLAFTNPSGDCNTTSDFSSIAPGIQLGYLHQFLNNFVSGIEANATFNTSQKNALDCNCSHNPNVGDRFLFRNKAQTSIKGRLGYSQNGKKGSLLPYVTAGASFANVSLTYRNEGGDYYSQTNTQAGALVGAGIEWAFHKDWSLRAEYSYVDYGNAIKMRLPDVYGLIDSDGKARIGLNTNNIMLAINYWF